jgi:hypothetical protein
MAIGGASGGGGNARGIRAGAAYVELGLKSTLDAQLKDAAKKLNTFGASATKIGGGLLAGGGAVAGGILGGALPQLDELARLNSAGMALGSSGEGVSKLFGALKSVGGDFKEDLEGITQFLQKVQDAASGKDGEGAKLFDGLKVSAEELMKLPVEEKFFRIHDAIRQLPQDQQIFKLSMLGGTDSMKKWLDVLAISNDELRRGGDTAAVSAADLDAATEANRALAEATGAVDRAWKQVAVGAAPAVKFLADAVVDVAKPVVEWLKRNRELATGIALAAAGAAAFGAALVGVGGTIAVAGTVASVLAGVLVAVKGVLATLVSPLGLAAAAVAGLGYAFFTMTETGREFGAAIKGYFAESLNTITSAWGGIKDAFQAGDMRGVWRIAVAALNVEWQRFLELFRTGWARAKLFFTEVWIEAVAFAKTTFLELADGALWAKLLAAGAAAVTQWGGFCVGLWQGVRDAAVAAFRAIHELATANTFDLGQKLGAMAVERIAPVMPAVAKGEELKKAFEQAAEDFGRGIALQGKAGIRAAADAARAEAQQAAEVARTEAAGVVRDARRDLDALVAESDRRLRTKLFADFMNALQDAPAGGGLPQLDQLKSTYGAFAGQLGGYLGQAFGPRSVAPQVMEIKKTNQLLQENNALLARIANNPGVVFG